MGTYDGNSVQDVQEGGQDLSVEVGRHESADWRHGDDDGDDHGRVPPRLLLDAVHHELAPEETWRTKLTLKFYSRLSHHFTQHCFL